jgi:predicted regulator of Ras-like GTPase activity (Roadblock/LC7/MglB family)
MKKKKEEAEVPPVKETIMEEEETEELPLIKSDMEEEEVEAPPVNETVVETDEVEVPPVKEIREQLSNFEMKVPVWGLTVFTIDGYIIAHKLFYDDVPNDIGMAISSMSAGLITISENFIRMVDSKNLFRQVLVDSDDADSAISFSILLKNIAENVMLACIFPSTTQLGLVTFEVENLSNEILDIVNRWDVKLHEDTVT